MMTLHSECHSTSIYDQRLLISTPKTVIFSEIVSQTPYIFRNGKIHVLVSDACFFIVHSICTFAEISVVLAKIE